eukprot:NODE_4559_length_771_cov_17.118012_g4400_i0.p1 GENE.NODE_4559_length_771_cov_17.118012_g4400_i0~~NODE_4559_length_771_cov_17.118012_g4400_i0.p1  ORF type:complete len:189 (+),score=50.50 NODE_4559_length_771_cov_17.118012_g4400_i0:106-672(+)
MRKDHTLSKVAHHGPMAVYDLRPMEEYSVPALLDHLRAVKTENVALKERMAITDLELSKARASLNGNRRLDQQVQELLQEVEQYRRELRTTKPRSSRGAPSPRWRKPTVLRTPRCQHCGTRVKEEADAAKQVESLRTENAGLRAKGQQFQASFEKLNAQITVLRRVFGDLKLRLQSNPADTYPDLMAI